MIFLEQSISISRKDLLNSDFTNTEITTNSFETTLSIEHILCHIIKNIIDESKEV